jgi:hypothetical protein
MAFDHLRHGKSLSQAINAVPGLSISRNGLSKQWKKHQEGSSLSAPVQDTELPSWGANLAAVSAAVLEERKLPKGVKWRSCEAIMQAVSQLPNLGRSLVNTHIRNNSQEEGGTGAGRQGEETFDSEGGLTSCVCCACKGKWRLGAFLLRRDSRHTEGAH